MNKTQLFCLLAALVPASAFAHIEPGTYLGKTPEGAACEMVAIRQYYEGGMRHPLTERVVVSVGATEFTLGHPPVLDASQAVASFNHDAFHSVQATSTGARALVVDMVHAEGSEGPAAYHLIEHAWKKDERKGMHCLGLVRQ